MKTTLLTLALCLGLGSNAKAAFGNEGPQAIPQAELPPQIIATIVFGGGNMPPFPEAIRSIEIDIVSDGTVELRKYRNNGKQEYSHLLKFDPEVAQKLQATVYKIKPGNLVDPTPDSPRCMDAPGTDLFVIVGAKKIQIASHTQCKEFTKVNATEDDQTMTSVLYNLFSMASALGLTR